MAQVTGLHQRSGVYQLRIMVPKDLLDHYGKSVIRFSLGTSSRTEATYKATLTRANWLAQFEQQRQELHPQMLDKVTPELALQLAERLRASVPGLDGARLPQTSLDGLTEPEAAELALVEQTDHSTQLMACMQLSAVLPKVQAEAQKLGLSFTENTPGAREALKVSLGAYYEARLHANHRDAGETIEAPRIAAHATPATPSRTLRDVYERWKTSGESPRTKDSIQAMDRALRQFEGQHPGLLLAGITREMGDKYRTWLRANSGTPKTARDHLTAIKSLLKYACRELEWTQRHTWEGLDIKATTTNKRRAITTAEMEKLFGTHLHTQYTLPKAKQAGRDAAYWIPLLGAYTGARLGELCQLRTVDVQTVDGIPALVLTDDGEDQTIKSEAGHRTIPIHSELIRLGFLEYAEAMRKAGRASLWPSLGLRKGKPSDYFGRWFKQFRTALEMVGKGAPSFHYFRHTVRPLMRRAGFDSMTRDLVTGHETGGSVGDKVYDGLLLEELRPAIEAIRHEGLNLPQVSPYGFPEWPQA